MFVSFYSPAECCDPFCSGGTYSLKYQREFVVCVMREGEQLGTRVTLSACDFGQKKSGRIFGKGDATKTVDHTAACVVRQHVPSSQLSTDDLNSKISSAASSLQMLCLDNRPFWSNTSTLLAGQEQGDFVSKITQSIFWREKMSLCQLQHAALLLESALAHSAPQLGSDQDTTKLIDEEKSVEQGATTIPPKPANTT